MSRAAEVGRPWILPNLAAEEGADWSAYPAEPHARVAAQLLSLLFASTARRAHARPDGTWDSVPVSEDWPAALGPLPECGVEPWLDTTPDAFAWLNTRSLALALAGGLPGQPRVLLAGPDPDCVRALHDKRFAVESARALGLHSNELDPLILVLEPEELLQTEETLARLARALEAWPAWTARRFTLKPRFGTSGRGRTGGRDRVDVLRGALARLARRGGAVFEPWLERRADLSVALHLPSAGSRPTVLASFEMLTTKSGVFRGHCGELDVHGVIRSGDPEDGRLREGACAVAARASAMGFAGACGVDAFRYREGQHDAWRGVVEFNARPTMGLVSYGLIRRATTRLRAAFPASNHEPRGFLFTLLDGAEEADGDARRDAILANAGDEAFAIDLSPRRMTGDPRPLLFFAADRKSLREAHRAAIGC